MKEEGFIQNIVLIIVLLTVVFLSQQSFFRPVENNLYSMVSQKIGSPASKIGDWLRASLYPKVSGEVTKGGVAAVQEINNQKNIAAQNVWEKIKNYFAEKFSNISGTQVK